MDIGTAHGPQTSRCGHAPSHHVHDGTSCLLTSSSFFAFAVGAACASWPTYHALLVIINFPNQTFLIKINLTHSLTEVGSPILPSLSPIQSMSAAVSLWDWIATDHFDQLYSGSTALPHSLLLSPQIRWSQSLGTLIWIQVLICTPPNSSRLIKGLTVYQKDFTTTSLQTVKWLSLFEYKLLSNLDSLMRQV